MKPDGQKQILKYLSNPHLWVMILLLAVGLFLHYPQQLLGLHTTSVFSFLGIERHAIERIYLLVPIAYASFFIGTKTGFSALIVALAIMLPRVFMFSEYMPDALAETIAIALIGGAEAWWFSHYRSERSARLAALANLENKNTELQRYTDALEKDESRLSTLNKISVTISQSIELSSVLKNAVDAVCEVMNVDAAWIYILSEDKKELNLAARRDFSEAYSKIKVGSGISGKVVETGIAELVENIADDPRLARSFKEKNTSLVIVPLTAKGEVNGTLGVSSQTKRRFSQSDVELLKTVGNQIGVAIENARLFQNQLEISDKLKSAYDQLQASHRQLEASQEQLVQAEKLTSLGELAASVAHEVNNPIAGILVYDQLLKKKLQNNAFEKEDGINILTKMENELIRIGRLIRRLLDFSRQTEACLGPVNMNDVLDNILSLVNHAAEMQRVKVVKELAQDLPTITADSDQMNQVFMNLSMNAIQAMPQGGILTVRTSRENGRVKVEVQDTGVGISKENMRNLFTPFFSTKKDVKGVGLGLAVSHGIIEQHRGKIEVVSEEGKGTTFTVYLNAD